MDDRQLVTKPQPRDKTLLPIIVGVITIHLCACLWISYFDQTSSKFVPKETPRLKVQTITLLPPQKKHPQTPLIAATTPPPTSIQKEFPTQELPKPQDKPLASTVSPPKKNPPPEPKIIPQKKTSTPKPPAPKKAPTPSIPSTTPKKTSQPKAIPKKTPTKPAIIPPKAENITSVEPSVKETALKKQVEEEAVQARAAAQKRQQALISQAQERIAKIAPTHDKITPTQTVASLNTALPTPINNLKIDDVSNGTITQFGEREASYRDELANRMKLLLQLPEYGDVKIKLILDRAGKVVQVDIISAQSTKNRNYIEKTVPTLSFPSFGNHFGTEAQHTFSITLSNDL